MTNALTIRLEDGGAMVSRDDGVTYACDGSIVAKIFQELERADRVPVHGASAAMLASIAEAAEVHPRPRTLAPRPPLPRAGGEVVSLGPLARPLPLPLGKVLDRRRSERTLGPLELADVATVLVHGARVRAFTKPDALGFQATFRASPSAGARHPFDFVVLNNHVVGLEASPWWTFDADACALAPLAFAEKVTTRVRHELRALLGTPSPPAAAFALADFERTLSRYPGGSTLVWRDAGAALTTLHLCASSAGIASCILACAGVIARPTDRLERVDVGALALGGRVHADGHRAV